VWPARTRYVLNGRLQASGYRHQELQRVVPLLRTTALMCYGSALVVCAVIRDSHYHFHGVQPGRAQVLPPAPSMRATVIPTKREKSLCPSTRYS
jgi:hypothetical protein